MLWKEAQPANSLDEALRRLFEVLYSEDERELFYPDGIKQVQKESRGRFSALLSEFQSEGEIDDPIELYEERIAKLSPQWRQAFEDKVEKKDGVKKSGIGSLQ